MSASLKVWGVCRALAVRTRPAAPKTEPFLSTIPRRRWYSDDINKPQPTSTSSNATSSQSGALNSTPESASNVGQAPAAADPNVEDTIHNLGDEALEKIFYGGRAAPSEADGGLTEAQQEALFRDGTIPSPAEAEEVMALAESDGALKSSNESAVEALQPGLKFPLPPRPLPADFNHKKRYHPVLDQLVRLMMRHGKLGVAQRNMTMVMNYLRMAPAPIYSPKFPLLPGTPPASHLPLNPILYITIAIDSVAPLMKLNHIAGGAGGGRALEMPTPLAVRQRRRTAFKWILDVVEKKPSKGSGKKQLAHRLAEEIVAVIEGRSSVWEKRRLVHKVGTAARANLATKKKMKKKMN